MPRALDREIHEQVMGFTLGYHRCHHCAEPVRGPRACTIQGCPAEVNQSMALPMAPPYSTDLAAAWRVVEHLHAQGWWVRVSYEAAIFDDRDDHGYEVIFQDMRTHFIGGVECEGSAVILPEAICLAALAVSEAMRREESDA